MYLASIGNGQALYSIGVLFLGVVKEPNLEIGGSALRKCIEEAPAALKAEAYSYLNKFIVRFANTNLEEKAQLLDTVLGHNLCTNVVVNHIDSLEKVKEDELKQANWSKVWINPFSNAAPILLIEYLITKGHISLVTRLLELDDTENTDKFDINNSEFVAIKQSKDKQLKFEVDDYSKKRSNKKNPSERQSRIYKIEKRSDIIKR